jgi:6-phosphogluconolactonase
MKLSVFPSSMETARSLIFHLVDIMNAEPDKTFNIAVSGGSTPALMFDLWANEYADITPWKRMKLYWVDERCVPPDQYRTDRPFLRCRRGG